MVNLTIKDIANLANVSIATVSNVINNNDDKVSTEVKQKIQTIIKDNGYLPNHIAKNLRKQKTDIIGIIVEDIRTFNTPYILKGIYKCAGRENKQFLLYDMSILSRTGENAERMKMHRKEVDFALNALLSAKVDGIIYIAWQDRDISDLVRKINVPLVYAYCYSDKDDRAWVSYDNVRIMREIMNKLIRLGHHKIAVAWGGEFCRPAQQRLDVYMEVLKQYQIPYCEDYTRHGDWSYEDGVRFYRYFMGLENPPTAIIFMNDEMAVGAVTESMKTDRKVLSDVSILGFNNKDFTRFIHPNISTVELPLEEIGYQAAEQLIRQIKDKNTVLQQLILNCRFIERESMRQNLASN